MVPLVRLLFVIDILPDECTGKRLAAILQALGMQVLIADRRHTTSPRHERTPFAEVLRQSTVIVVVVPKTGDTTNLISGQELGEMNRQVVIVNISRGGIVNEAAVVAALKNGTIAGYATDVFAVEPAEGGKDSPLLGEDARGVNLTLSPHVAWFGERTRRNLVEMLQQNVEMYMAGIPQNVIA
jgi:glycerate dehydrogenase